MLLQIGRIQTLNQDSAVVEMAARPVCARCARGEGCGFGFLNADGAGPHRLVLSRPPGIVLRVGDRVEIGLAESGLLRASLIAYGVPGAGVVVGASLASIFRLSEPASVLLTLSAFVAGLLLARRMASSAGTDRRCQPKLLGVTAGHEASDA